MVHVSRQSLIMFCIVMAFLALLKHPSDKQPFKMGGWLEDYGEFRWIRSPR